MEARDQNLAESDHPAVNDASTTNATPHVSSSTSSSIVSAASGAFRWLTSTASTLGHAVEEALKDEDDDAEGSRRRQQEAEEQEENAIDAMAVELTSESSQANGVFTPSKLNYAITPVLLEFATALAEYESTFLHFPRGHQTFVLTRTQEAHARALLASCEPIARLRFRLVPRQMKESEFWRIYFTLMRQVARKVARTDGGEATTTGSVASSPASTAAAPASTASATSTPAPLSSAASPNTMSKPSAVASPDFSPASSIATPLRSTLDYDEIDRLCGTKNLHGRRISMGVDDDASDDESDTQTDAVIAEIVRRHRSASGSFDPIPSPSAKTPQHASKQLRQDSSDFASPSVYNTSTDFGVTDAELDAAFEAAKLEEEQAAASTQIASADQLP